jgi:hypothetical protein
MDIPISWFIAQETRSQRICKTWRHSDRTAVVVGDLMDRGPRQLATLDRVRNMVEAETATCIMSNHEFNVIAWATPVPDFLGKNLRDHGSPGNREQHQAFLAEIADAGR